jgi:hypothetical protein
MASPYVLSKRKWLAYMLKYLEYITAVMKATDIKTNKTGSLKWDLLWFNAIILNEFHNEINDGKWD